MGKPMKLIAEGIEFYASDIKKALENPSFEKRDASNLLVKYGILTRYLICWAKRQEIYTPEIAKMRPPYKSRVLARKYRQYKEQGIEKFGVEERKQLEEYTTVFKEELENLT